MGVLARRVREKIEFLESVEHPPNVICHHLGEHLKHAGLSIGIGTRANGHPMLITLYDHRCMVKGFARHGERADDDRYHVGQSRAVHEARARSISKALNAAIVDRWNGMDGNSGISIELDRALPSIVATGILNYRAMPSPFDLRDDDREGFEAYKSAIEAAQHAASKAA